MAFRTGSTTSTVVNGATSITIPSAVQIGDTMILWGTSPTGTSPPTTPTGWTLQQSFTGTGSTSCKCYLFMRTATSGDTGGSTVVSFTTNGNSAFVFCSFTNFGAFTYGTTLSTTDGFTATSPSIASTQDGCDVVELFGTMCNPSSTGITSPPSTVAVNANSSGIARSASSISYQAQGTQGATGSNTASLASSGSWVGVTLIIEPGNPGYRSGSATSLLGNSTVNSPQSITISSAVQIGDLMLLGIATFYTIGITTPSGWNLLRTADQGVGTNNVKLWVFWRVATSGDTGGSTTVSIVFGPNVTGMTAILAAYNGVSSPILSSANVSSSSGTTLTSPSITTTSSNSIVVEIFAIENDTNATAANIVGPNTTRLVAGVSTFSGIAFSDQVQTTAGATASKSATANSNSAWVGLTLALPTIPPPGPSGTLIGGSILIGAPNLQTFGALVGGAVLSGAGSELGSLVGGATFSGLVSGKGSLSVGAILSGGQGASGKLVAGAVLTAKARLPSYFTFVGSDLSSLEDIEIHLVDSSGFRLSPVSSAALKNVTWQLDDSGTAVFDLSKLDPVAAQLMLVRTEVQIVFNNTPGPEIWWGFPVRRKRTPKSDSVNCEGLLSYFKTRIVGDSQGVGLGQSLVYDTWDQFNIAYNLIVWSQIGPNYWRNISILGTPCGVTRSRTYLRESHEVIYNILQSFNADKLNNGFDSEIVLTISGDTGTRIWTPYYPTKGINHPTPLEWGTQIIDYTLDEDALPQRTKLYATGGTDGATKFEAPYEDPVASGYYGAMVGVISDAQELDPTWLAAKAQQAVASLKNPIQSFTIVVSTLNLDNPVFGYYHTGDVVRIDIDDYSTQIHGLYRIANIKYNNNGSGADNTLSIVLVGTPNPFKPPSDMPAIINRLDNRISVLENTITSPTILPWPPSPIAFPPPTTWVPPPTSTPGISMLPDIPFDNPGPLGVVTSPHIISHRSLTAVAINITLVTAGSTATTISLLKNGSIVTSITLGAGETYKNRGFPPVYFQAGIDSYAIQISAAGTGAVGLGGSIAVTQ